MTGKCLITSSDCSVLLLSFEGAHFHENILYLFLKPSVLAYSLRDLVSIVAVTFRVR